MTIQNRHRVVIGSGEPIRVGISTCPNDTFAFAAILEQRVGLGGFRWEIDLLDIQQLNADLFSDTFDIAKASFHAAIVLADRTIVLPVGSALGFGVGPLLLAANSYEQPKSTQQVTLCPGEHTTAKLLFDLFYPQTTSVRHVVFSEIMPALERGEADFGVCIHEGRFTYQESGLHLVADLGTQWETESDTPLPLGGLLGRREMPSDRISRACEVISDSLAVARSEPASALSAMRRYAQEFNDDILMQHVDLYVNEWTVDLGPVGRRALETLCERSVQAGVTADRAAQLRVFG